MKVGIKLKLIAFTTFLLIIVISFLSFFVLNGIKQYQNKQAEDTLFNQKDMFEQYISERASSNNDKVELVRGSIFNKPWLRTIPSNIYDINGELLSGFQTDSRTNENKDKEIMLKYAIEGKVSYETSNGIIYFYSPIKYKNKTVVLLELQYPIKDNLSFYESIEKMFYIIGALSLSIGVMLGIVYFWGLTRDIYIMKNSVESIQKGEFKAVRKIKRQDELGQLSSGICLMSNTIEKNIEELRVERDYLSRAVDKLRKMDEQQKEFIGNITHEFKTPITSIRAYSDLMTMYEDDINLIKEGSNSISKECQRLTDMVDRVLKIAAVEKYDFEIEKSEINIKEVIISIVKRMMGKIKRNNLTLECNMEDAVISCDEESLNHIIVNILDNAIKYSRDNGCIKISCHKEENKAILQISDNGIGIDEKSLPNIFQAFYRSEQHRSRKTGGVGLGLALVKKLVEKQNGVINVESALNEGTTFSIEFFTIS
ncbi:HAMP domain-containing histidine kinase [Clostridium sp. 19966]|uniref:sensor histidine kinase n=1 Tax=Clostridium sp. 19966 TaxID=2768166 RepID=UPI0028DFDBBC|nr:HAMP domain-containing sensor histidine kinase [Clostridium sp. 19966]MDT8717404.1 HAMP domain-containing histidine kinase [Clostridium sp. 19966]